MVHVATRYSKKKVKVEVSLKDDDDNVKNPSHLARISGVKIVW